MKSFIVSSVCLLAMTVSACAKSPPITRIVRVDCSEGLDLRQYEPGERPRVIDEGEDWRDYGEEMFATAETLHARLTAAHGALVECRDPSPPQG